MAVAMKCWGRAKQTCNLNWKNDKPYMWKYYLYTPCIYIHQLYIYIYTHLHHIQYHLLTLKHEFVGILIPYMFKETHELAPKQLAS